MKGVKLKDKLRHREGILLHTNNPCQFADMSDVYHPPERVAGESHCRGMQKYQEMYQESIDDPTRLE